MTLYLCQTKPNRQSLGLLISITILFITRNATVTMWYRLMDAIDPDILSQAEAVVQ